MAAPECDLLQTASTAYMLLQFFKLGDMKHHLLKLFQENQRVSSSTKSEEEKKGGSCL